MPLECNRVVARATLRTKPNMFFNMETNLREIVGFFFFNKKKIDNDVKP